MKEGYYKYKMRKSHRWRICELDGEFWYFVQPAMMIEKDAFKPAYLEYIELEL